MNNEQYDLDRIYQEGYAVGVTGVRSMCPEPYQSQLDDSHVTRDAWVEGYKDGRKEFQVLKEGTGRSTINKVKETYGRLWVDRKVRDHIHVRDTEGGTILASVRVSDAQVVMPNHGVLNPVMAQWVSRAVGKAAAIAWTIQFARDQAREKRDERP